jgi:hypothetical protein
LARPWADGCEDGPPQSTNRHERQQASQKPVSYQRDFSKTLISGKIGKFGREIDKIPGFIFVFLERDELSLITLYSYSIERFHGSVESLRDSTSSHIDLELQNSPVPERERMPGKIPLSG